MSDIDILTAHGLTGGKKPKGNALPGDVLAGKTFSGANVDPETAGTMPNRGAPNITAPAAIPPGYYSGGNVVKPAVPAPTVQTFDASGTWNKPAGAMRHLVECWGAGGGGDSYGSGGGGGGGAYRAVWLDSAALAASAAVTVGAGGAYGQPGGSGGNSTFVSGTTTVTGPGGVGGGGNTDGSTHLYINSSQYMLSPYNHNWGGSGGDANGNMGQNSGDTSPSRGIGGDNYYGGGGGGANLYSKGGQRGGNSVYGAGGGGGGQGDSSPAPGGASTYGGAGGNGFQGGTNATDGQVPGGGGGGGTGNGARGRVRVTTYYS